MVPQSPADKPHLHLTRTGIILETAAAGREFDNRLHDHNAIM
jgi:hypothetical protein